MPSLPRCCDCAHVHVPKGLSGLGMTAEEVWETHRWRLICKVSAGRNVDVELRSPAIGWRWKGKCGLKGLQFKKG